MGIQKYRKKPVVIEAVQWLGEEGSEVDAFFTKEEHRDKLRLVLADGYDEGDEARGEVLYALEIETLEGTMTAQPRDWVIRGVKGEIYPVRKDIFEETYESAE